MTWIVEKDLHVQIKSERLTQIIDEDTDVLDDAEQTALAVVSDALSATYDTTAIFNTTGTERPAQVVRWVRAIMLYEISGRLPEKMVSERLVKNYDDTINTLTEIEEGRKATTLPKRTENTEGGLAVNRTQFRWGSNPKRSHNI